MNTWAPRLVERVLAGSGGAHFVVVHGVTAGVRSGGWSEVLRERVGVDRGLWHEVCWADLARAAGEEIERGVLGRWGVGGGLARGWRWLRSVFGLWDLADDFVLFLSVGSFRRAVRRRFDEVMRGVPDGAEIVVVAHSVGGFAAVEWLICRVEAGGRRNPLRGLVTVCSPLRVLAYVRGGGKLGEMVWPHETVGRWWNLWGRWDVVSRRRGRVRGLCGWVREEGVRLFPPHTGWQRSGRLREILRGLK